MGRPNLSREKIEFSGANENIVGKLPFFPVQLTTSKIGMYVCMHVCMVITYI